MAPVAHDIKILQQYNTMASKKSKIIRPNMSEYGLGCLWAIVSVVIIIFIFAPGSGIYSGKEPPRGVLRCIPIIIFSGVAYYLAKKRQAKEQKEAALVEERERLAAMEAREAQQREVERQQMLCPTCGGSGQGVAGSLCTICGGSGTRRVELCPICGGQGVNAAGCPCPYCGGRGKYFVN